MFEVLIGLALLCFAALSSYHLQYTTYRVTQNATTATIASLQIDNLIQQINLHQADAESGIRKWQQETKKLFPGVRIKTTGQFPILKIEMKWGKTTASCSDLGLGKQCISRQIDFSKGSKG